MEVLLVLQHQADLKQSSMSTDGTTALHYVVRHRVETAEMKQKYTMVLDHFLQEVPVDVPGK